MKRRLLGILGIILIVCGCAIYFGNDVLIRFQLQRDIFATESGKALKGKVAFSTTPSWVRHDEHYHIDFTVDKSP
jgi:hypothetical protein